MARYTESSSRIETVLVLKPTISHIRMDYLVKVFVTTPMSR